MGQSGLMCKKNYSYILSSVEVTGGTIANYSLSQNFSNPFNPTTTFRYSVPQLSKVVIKVFDILGEQIKILMDEEKSAGTYELSWNTTYLPRGVYFYQLRAGDHTAVKKMILLK